MWEKRPQTLLYQGDYLDQSSYIIATTKSYSLSREGEHQGMLNEAVQNYRTLHTGPLPNDIVMNCILSFLELPYTHTLCWIEIER